MIYRKGGNGMSFKKYEDTYITIMNFSNIYKKEDFYKHDNINWIECSSIEGTSCYCDKEAERMIKDQISHLSPKGIHFIDSGNYHYVSEFWMEKIQEDFNLVIFDHHSDMQKPLFGSILSCGSWVMNAIDKNSFIKNVILIGVGEEEKKLIEPKYMERIVCIDKDEFNTWEYENSEIEEYPVYISIDKDVLSEEVIDTNWSQGDMMLSELESILHRIIAKNKVIGIDICGECRCELDKLAEIEENNMTNLELLEFLKKERRAARENECKFCKP